jgi:hypothetical protein
MNDDRFANVVADQDKGPFVPRPAFPGNMPLPFAYEPPPADYVWDGKVPHWRGFPVKARRVLVSVGPADLPNSWVNGLEGTERRAVEVTYEGRIFFLDDDEGEGTPIHPAYLGDHAARLTALEEHYVDLQSHYDQKSEEGGYPSIVRSHHGAGSGWRHLTLGRGALTGPHHAHRILPPGTTVIRELKKGEGA